MHDPLQRLYRTKLVLLAILLVGSGFALLILGNQAEHDPRWQWLRLWPITDIGTALFTTGLLGVALQYFDGQDSEVRATQRLERVINAATPAMRDAVIAGFAFEPSDLARVATPATLDQIITHALAIRLGDAAFASDICDDLRLQAIDVPERLHDARVSIRLSRPRSTPGKQQPRFIATVRWEFDLVPIHQTRRFVCLDDLEQFRELDRNGGATSAWYIKPRAGVRAAERDAFELIDFSVDGQPRPIRRSSRASGQAYSVDLGKGVLAAGESVTIAYTYRTVANDRERLLQLRVDQPTKGLTVTFDYTDTDIASVRVLDFIASGRPARVSTPPPGVPDKSTTVEFQGWVFARSGLAFVWGSADGRPAKRVRQR